LLNTVKVRLQPLVSNLNLPTVIKTAVPPGDPVEKLFIATQVGEIFHFANGAVEMFLDIRDRIIELGANGGYDERGLLGMAFHPEFHSNGLFYLHYSVSGTQGPGALAGQFEPNPCDLETLNLHWEDRETRYDHIDTVEEWIVTEGQPEKKRTLLNLRRPFMNHNGVNSLNFSPETGKLILTTGDGGAGYDPFNISQDNMEIAGKIIEIDTSVDFGAEEPPVVTRFDQLPPPIQGALSVMAKGVRNIPGITFQRFNNQYIKFAGNVGQNLVESIYAFSEYDSIPVTEIVQSSEMMDTLFPWEEKEMINFGWRGWEGDLPTPIIRNCTGNFSLDDKVIAYYQDAIATSVQRLRPLTTYYHQDNRLGKFEGTALTGVQAYMGYPIYELTTSVVFTDLANRSDDQSPGRGVLAYTRLGPSWNPNEYALIETDYDFGDEPAFYVSLGANQEQTRLFLGVYGSTNVTDYNKGMVCEILP
jgi:hypothetical protein